MRGGAGGDEGDGDGASTNVPIAPRDASDGREPGLVLMLQLRREERFSCLL